MAITSMPILAGTLSVSTAGECSPGTLPIYTAAGELPQAGNTGAAPFGGAVTLLPVLSGKNDDGTTLAASAAAGKFGLSNTTGTSLLLLSEAANNNTKTDKVIFEMIIPGNYVANSTFTVVVNALYTPGAGTASVKTVQAKLYLIANAGTEGSDLIAGSAQTVTTSAADYTFTCTTPTLAPRARVLIQITSVLTETASSNVTLTVNSVRLA